MQDATQILVVTIVRRVAFKDPSQGTFREIRTLKIRKQVSQAKRQFRHVVTVVKMSFHGIRQGRLVIPKNESFGTYYRRSSGMWRTQGSIDLRNGKPTARAMIEKGIDRLPSACALPGRFSEVTETGSAGNPSDAFPARFLRSSSSQIYLNMK